MLVNNYFVHHELPLDTNTNILQNIILCEMLRINCIHIIQISERINQTNVLSESQLNIFFL